MASEPKQDVPLPSGSHSPHFTGPAGDPVDIRDRVVESPQPVSEDEAPPDDALGRPQRDASLPKLPPEIEVVPAIARSGQSRPSLRYNSSQTRRTELDWIIPVAEPKREPPRPKTLEERIIPTLETAKSERAKYELKAKMTGYALNIAIGLQVVLGALTTGLSVVTTGRQTSIMTAILGGLSTTVASYLARARGSNEPELSITRCKDLEAYIRTVEVFILDFGHLTSYEHDSKLHELRERFEELLGNGNGERRLSSV
ncbi:hypothetical protein FB451DRAFT_1251228 [Mycena latifolia]|nr:hypothetical protein FB451DRAFT_1251228 [Mycena latifolia]